MQQDDVIWQVVKSAFCSFKIKTDTQHFCRNEYNVTGLCSRSSCPLANSRYATVREHDGRAYLYMKTIERAHTPSRLWERILLPKSYVEALEVIESELLHHPESLQERCKQRLTRIAEYMSRMRKMQVRGVRNELVPVKKATDRRERKREARAEAVARLDKVIAAELVERLKAGSYDDVILNSREGVWSRVLRSREVKAKPDVEEQSDDEEMQTEYIEDLSEMEEENEQLQTREMIESDSDTSDLEDFADTKPTELTKKSTTIKSNINSNRGKGSQFSRRGGARGGRGRVEIEYEQEGNNTHHQQQRIRRN